MYPTPHTVTHTPRVVVGRNAMGQAKYGDGMPRQRGVYGWRNKSTVVGRTPQTAERVISEVYLLTPEGDWAHGDIVALPGRGRWRVHGDVEDFNTGPFGFTPGYRVTLQKVVDGGS